MPLPKDVRDLIPKTCEYVTLHCKRDFAVVIKFRILRWGDYLDNSSEPDVNTTVLTMGMKRGSESDEEYM